MGFRALLDEVAYPELRLYRELDQDLKSVGDSHISCGQGFLVRDMDIKFSPENTEFGFSVETSVTMKSQ